MPWWAPAGLAGLLLLLGTTIWEPFPPGVWHDDGVYVLLGRAMAEGEGLHYAGVTGTPAAGKFPPAFPLVLAGIWKLSPEFPGNAALLGGVNLLLLALAGGIFALFLNRALGLAPMLSVGAACLAWLSPHLWRVALIPLSEPLFLGALTLALWAGVRMERSKGAKPIILFLLLGAVAFYTRTLGLSVLVAGVAALVLRRRPWSAALTLLGVSVVVFPWLLWSRAATASLPEPLRDTLGSYAGWWIRQVVAEPAAFLALLPSKLSLMADQMSSLLLPGSGGAGGWVGTALVPLAFLGFWEVRSLGRILPLTLGAAFLVLLVWPFQDLRLLVPFGPFLVLGALLAFGSVAKRLPNRRWLSRGITGLAAIWVLAFTVLAGKRLWDGWPGAPYRVRAEALERAVGAVSEKTPLDAVIGAPELWSGIHLFTGRVALPSARFFPLAQAGPSWGTPEEQYELWLAGGITHILVEHGGGVHGAALDRVDALCSAGTVQVLDLQPGQFLVRLNWDRECQNLLLDREG
jgi:hypothetical protein